MIILIDGYNLLKGASGGREVSEAERRTLIHKLGIYAKRKKHRVVLVFDGGQTTWPFKETVAGVIVIYSGTKQTADKVIKHYIADHASKEILLVTTDRDLNHFASKQGKVSIDSQDFLVLLMEFLEAPVEIIEQEVEIVIDEDETDLALIMQQASVVIPQKTEDFLKAARQTPAMSKKDRILMKKLKKL